MVYLPTIWLIFMANFGTWWLERSFPDFQCSLCERKVCFSSMWVFFLGGEDILDCKLWISYHHLYGNIFLHHPLDLFCFVVL